MAAEGRVRRVDVIRAILQDAGGRLRTKELARELRKREETHDVPYSALYIAINAENERLQSQGKSKAFVTRRDGEEHGWISLSSGAKAGTRAAAIEHAIFKANEDVDAELKKRLQAMAWRTFETTFLVQVLEKLGFQNVQVTQATRDGGVDARVAYKRGVVEAKAIVSAKHWSVQKVPVTEVRQMRGIKGDEDTAIIVTTGRFSDDAKAEALPGQNQRVVFLIDGERLVEVCKEHKIGVRQATLPPLLEIDPDELSAFGLDPESVDDDSEEESEPQGVVRLRVDMLGDDERGLSAAEVAKLVELEESTVRSYFSNEDRRRGLAERIREDEKLRARALKIINRKREQ